MVQAAARDLAAVITARSRSVLITRAAAWAALACGWAYVVVGLWREHAVPAMDAISSQRRPLRDPLGLQPGLLADAEGGLTFGELAVSGPYEPVARAQLLHLL